MLVSPDYRCRGSDDEQKMMEKRREAKEREENVSCIGALVDDSGADMFLSYHRAGSW